MRDFIQELRERNVFCVAAVYGVIGWIAIQLSTVLETKFLLMETTDTYVAVAFYLGLPIALLVAWFVEMTPDGLQFRSKVDSDDINEAVEIPSTDYVMAGAFALLACFVTADIVVPDRAVPLSAEAVERDEPQSFSGPVIVELPAPVQIESTAVAEAETDPAVTVETAGVDAPDITADLPTGSVSMPSVIE